MCITEDELTLLGCDAHGRSDRKGRDHSHRATGARAVVAILSFLDLAVEAILGQVRSRLCLVRLVASTCGQGFGLVEGNGLGAKTLLDERKVCVALKRIATRDGVE